jgi:hypothetical protein
VADAGESADKQSFAENQQQPERITKLKYTALRQEQSQRDVSKKRIAIRLMTVRKANGSVGQ